MYAHPSQCFVKAITNIQEQFFVHLPQLGPCTLHTSSLAPLQLMFASSSRLLAKPIFSSTANSLNPNIASLPPIRYHIFQNPLPYPTGLNLQNQIIDRRLASREGSPGGGRHDILLLLGNASFIPRSTASDWDVEHTPTYTTGRRDNSPNPDSLHPEEKKVQHVGAGFYITKRGGQVTYHGPGQLVGYPIFDLNAMEVSGLTCSRVLFVCTGRGKMVSLAMLPTDRLVKSVCPSDGHGPTWPTVLTTDGNPRVIAPVSHLAEGGPHRGEGMLITLLMWLRPRRDVMFHTSNLCLPITFGKTWAARVFSLLIQMVMWVFLRLPRRRFAIRPFLGFTFFLAFPVTKTPLSSLGLSPFPTLNLLYD